MKYKIAIVQATADNDSFYTSIFPCNNKCYHLETYFSNVVEKGNEYYSKGILVYHNGNLFGLTKFKGEKTIIPFENGIFVDDLGVYDIQKDVTEELKQLQNRANGDWLRIDVEGSVALGHTLERHCKIVPRHEIEGKRIFGDHIDKLASADEFREKMYMLYKENTQREPTMSIRPECKSLSAFEDKVIYF
ncbi:MAG: hypothetical protein JW789_00960 [Candidatus Aenigmarchaeota archaeon]|nr:hypothetical protein [Candidatus Aenigmarchaeota archaeon]